MKIIFKITIILLFSITANANELVKQIFNDTVKIYKGERICEGSLTSKSWFETDLLNTEKKEFFDQFEDPIRELNSGIFVMLDSKLVGTNAQFNRPSTYSNILIYPDAKYILDVSNDNVMWFIKLSLIAMATLTIRNKKCEYI